MDASNITRIELISPGGRESVTYYGAGGVTLHVQDDGRTLKITTPWPIDHDVWWEQVKSDPSYDPDWLNRKGPL